MEFTAELVWACAAAADRINEGYCKEGQGEWDQELGFYRELKAPNKHLVKTWLRENNFSSITDEDREQGQRYRDHFKSYTLLAMTGKINDFQLQALKIANRETFTGRDLLEFAIVSSLPSVARRDRERTDIKREIVSSTQLQGREGDRVQGTVTVMSSQFSANYFKYRITARLGDSIVSFWLGYELVKGRDYAIRGRIKRQNSDGSTQLNFVKVRG